MALFVDASYFIALLDPDDQWHEAAKALLPYLERNGPLVTHLLALGEVIAVVGSARGGKAAREASEILSDATEIRYPSPRDVERAMDLVVRYDGTVSLSDGLLLGYASLDPRRRVVSFDAGFDQKGFERVARPPQAR